MLKAERAIPHLQMRRAVSRGGYCVWSTRNCGKKELSCKKRYYFIKRKGVTI